MNLALCYENVLPSRGGCETYIADLSRRLAADGHEIHLYACQWDVESLPREMHYHRLPTPAGPRFLRPWRFSTSCIAALEDNSHHVSIGFDKTWGQDVLYPQGGLHLATAVHNLYKHRGRGARVVAALAKWLDHAAIRVVRSAIDPARFAEQGRPRRRLEWREHWGIDGRETIALFVAMNY